MAYTIHHTKKDGSVEHVRKCSGGISNLEKRPTNPVSGRTAAEADKNMNEEWWGIIGLSTETTGNINKRIPKKAYYILKKLWKR